jgi:hypothetical protein
VTDRLPPGLASTHDVNGWEAFAGWPDRPGLPPRPGRAGLARAGSRGGWGCPAGASAAPVGVQRFPHVLLESGAQDVARDPAGALEGPEPRFRPLPGWRRDDLSVMSEGARCAAGEVQGA